MKLALVRQRYNPFGGAERFIERAIASLERQGIEAVLVTREWRAAGGQRVLIVDPFNAGRLWRDVSFARGVRALLTREKFDLVQSHERIPGCDLYRAGDGVHRQWLEHRAAEAGFLERLGIRLNPYHWYVCAAEKTMFEHPALRGVICNSRMVAGEISRNFRIAAEKLHVIYNGVDLEYFHPDRRRALRAAARSELGCAEGDTLFAFVGSGFARKGLAWAIGALAATGRPDLKLAVAGRDRAVGRFEQLAARAGLADRVIFLGGKEDIRPLYAAADCFILPTRYDPFPNAALEALAMGLPVIVSSRCGAAELVRPGSNGWIWEPDSDRELGRMMTAAAAAVDEPMGGAARATAEEFGVERMAQRMVGLYESLLGRAAARAHGGN